MTTFLQPQHSHETEIEKEKNKRTRPKITYHKLDPEAVIQPAWGGHIGRRGRPAAGASNGGRGKSTAGARAGGQGPRPRPRPWACSGAHNICRKQKLRRRKKERTGSKKAHQDWTPRPWSGWPELVAPEDEAGRPQVLAPDDNAGRPHALALEEEAGRAGG